MGVTFGIVDEKGAWTLCGIKSTVPRDSFNGLKVGVTSIGLRRRKKTGSANLGSCRAKWSRNFARSIIPGTDNFRHPGSPVDSRNVHPMSA
jgi:hypothetical protein